MTLIKSTYWWHEAEALLTLLSVSSISQLFHLLQIINYVSLYSPGNPVDADSVNFRLVGFDLRFLPVVIWLFDCCSVNL